MFRTISLFGKILQIFCLSNQKFERLGGHLGEIETGSAHNTLPDATLIFYQTLQYDSQNKMRTTRFLIREEGWAPPPPVGRPLCRQTSL